MHVALVSPGWPPERHANGIVTYVRWIRQGLQRQGCQVSIFAFRVDEGVRDADVHLIERSAGSSLWQRLGSRFTNRRNPLYDGGRLVAAAIARVHARSAIDVIDMEESFGWAVGARDTSGLPVVVKLHGPAFLTLDPEEQAKPFGKEKIQREGDALERLPVILSPSRSHLTDTLGRYGLSPHLAAHVVNPLALSPGTPLWRLDQCDRNMLLFVGRFDRVKGGDVVIRAFQLLLRRRPSLRLVFAGPDDGLLQADGRRLHLAEFIATLGDAALAEAVTACGRLTPEDVARRRIQALCTIVASRRESQGYTALEAMLQGCPVVTTDASGLTELVEHGVNGLKARLGDADDLAAKLWQVIEAPAAGALLGSRARQYVLDHHDPDRVAAQTMDAYREAIAHSRAVATP